MVKAKKVLFVIEQAEISRYYFNLLKHLKSLDEFQFAVLNLKYSKEFTESLTSLQIPVYSLDINRRYLFKTVRILSEIKKIKPDVIHSHEIIASFFSGIYTILNSNTKLVYHRHHIKSNSIQEWVYSLIGTWKAAKVITVSNASKELAVSEFPFSKGKTEVIYNGIEAIQTNKKQEIISSIHFDLKLGMLARFRERKGHKLAIELVERLNEMGIYTCLSFAGDGATKEELISLVDKKNLSDQIFFLDNIEDLHSFFKSIDFHLIPSEFETFGLIAAEAMQNKVLNIASNVGGLTEIISHRRNGLLFKMGDLEDLLEKTLFAKKNRVLVEEMIKKGEQDFKNRFSSKSMATAYNELYKRI